MSFRTRAFLIHLSASVGALLAALGALYAGWYRWPGWYLSGASHLAAIVIGVDAALGPLLTLVVANPRKSRRELRRDIGLIVALQMIALTYGTATLWRGRPLYYAFSVNMLELVQASDLDPREAAAARRAGLALAPHWYSRPRWIWAPLPDDPRERTRIIASAVTGGYDVTSMPPYFKPWDQGHAALRTQLGKVGASRFFAPAEIARLEHRMRAAGLPTDQANSIPLMGRGRPLLAVFDPTTLRLRALIRCT